MATTPKKALALLAKADKEALAKSFATVLGEWIPDPQDRCDIVIKNLSYAASDDPLKRGCCASQEFCDANMAMDEAMKNLRLPTFGAFDGVVPEAVNEAICGVWNEAWDIARAAGFWWFPSPLPQYLRAFPGFAKESMPAIPEGFEDSSEPDCICPTFDSKSLMVRLWVQEESPEEREDPEGARFLVTRILDWEERTLADEGAFLVTDDWNEVLAALKGVA